MTFPETLVVTPGCVGGRLRTFNLILSAFHVAAGQGKGVSSPTLILDENLFGAQDLRLPIQNAHGDVVSLEVPDHGKFGHGSRAAFENALRDTLPQTGEVSDALDALLPPALQTPLEAATTLWSRCFPKLQIETVRRGAPSPPATELLTGITWGSARHFITLKDLGLKPEHVLEGESACLERLVPVPAGELGEITEQLRESVEGQLLAAKKVAAEVDPSLVGAWVRLRRILREALDTFAERADRCGRNRGGIRRARLHGLAQALRPHGGPQETGLSLLSAAASFPLEPAHPPTLPTSFSPCAGAEMLLRTS